MHGELIADVRASYGELMDPSWVRLTLDVEKFDADVSAAIDVCRRNGIVFTSMTGFGDLRVEPSSTVRTRTRTCSADIPDRGEFYTVRRLLRRAHHKRDTVQPPVVKCARRRRVGRDVGRRPTIETRATSSTR